MVNENLVLGEEHPIFSQVEGEQPPPTEDTETPPSQEQVEQPPENEEDFYIRLDKRRLAEEIQRLTAEDVAFRSVFNREVGNNAARRHQPRIRELEQHLETYQRLLRREQYGKLSQEEVAEKFQTDPEFAKNYAEVTHFQAEEPRIVPDNEVIVQQVQSGINQIIRAGVRAGLTRDDLVEIDANIKSGKYDTDADGNNMPPEQWEDMLGLLQDDVTEKIISRRGGSGVVSGEASPPSPVSPLATEPPPNSNNGTAATPPVQQTDTARPDMSAAGGRGVHTSTISMREFKALPWEEQFRMFPNEGDIERAVADGRITIEGAS